MSLKYSLPRSFGFALQGIKTAFTDEPNFRIHSAFALAALILAFFLGFSLNEWLLLLFTISFVLVMELVNTSLEEIVNLINPEVHPLVKKAKDLMAAAVLLSAFVAIIVGFFLFLPKILFLF